MTVSGKTGYYGLPKGLEERGEPSWGEDECYCWQWSGTSNLYEYKSKGLQRPLARQLSKLWQEDRFKPSQLEWKQRKSADG